MIPVLFAKVTLFFAAGLVALAVARKSTAAMRHLLCVCTLTGSLLLPLGGLLPSKALAFQTIFLDTAVTRPLALARTAAWPWSTAILSVWALGTALLSLRLAIGYRRAARLVRSATLINPPILTADVSVPMVSGLFRPAVLMPHAAAEWPEWQRNAAVRHELAHIERKDLWANLAANFACALYWFHPLVWALSSQMRREQEEACDDAVLHSGFDPAIYAEALLAVAKDAPAALFSGCSMATQTSLKSRITRLLGAGITRRTSRATSFAAALISAGILVAFVALSPVQAQQVYKAGGDVTNPRVVYRTEIPYTEEARREKIEGRVILSFVVGTDGLAHDISLQQHLDPGLERNAAESLEQWRFAPGTLNGVPVPVEATVEINFKLQ